MEKGDIYKYPRARLGDNTEYTVDGFSRGGLDTYISWSSDDGIECGCFVPSESLTSGLQSGHLKLIRNKYHMVPKWVRSHNLNPKLRNIPISFKKERNPYKEPNLYDWNNPI